MDDNIQVRPPRSFLRRRWKTVMTAALVLIGLGGLAGCAAQGAASPITPARQQTARQALVSPSGATLHLGHYGDEDSWFSHLDGAYAVQDGMVLFPEEDTSGVHARLGLPILAYPVLVYAPDGGDLSARPGPPAGRYIDSNEWFLIKCQAVALNSGWWECGLLFGRLLNP